MKNMQQSLQYGVGALCTFFGYFFGDFDGLLKTVIIFVVAAFRRGSVWKRRSL